MEIPPPNPADSNGGPDYRAHLFPRVVHPSFAWAGIFLRDSQIGNQIPDRFTLFLNSPHQLR